MAHEKSSERLGRPRHHRVLVASGPFSLMSAQRRRKKPVPGDLRVPLSGSRGRPFGRVKLIRAPGKELARARPKVAVGHRALPGVGDFPVAKADAGVLRRPRLPPRTAGLGLVPPAAMTCPNRWRPGLAKLLKHTPPTATRTPSGCSGSSSCGRRARRRPGNCLASPITDLAAGASPSASSRSTTTFRVATTSTQ